MIQEEFQDSDSSKDDDALVIKPPQTSSQLDYILHHRSKKKKRHSKEHKSNRKHHHHHHHHSHKKSHSKLSDADSYSKRNRNMESKSFHYIDNKEKDEIKESEKDLVDQYISDMRFKRLINDTENEREEKVKNKKITDVRHIRLVEDIREGRRYSNKNEKRSTNSLDELQIEWRKKRLLWLQHQKKQDERLWPNKEKAVQDKNHEKEFKEQHKSIYVDYSRNQKNITDCIQIGGEKNGSVISLVSSDEDNMDYEETEEITDEENDHESDQDHEENEHLSGQENEEIEHESDQEDTASKSDISSNDDNESSRSDDESVESGSANENEKVVSQNESLLTKSIEESKAVATFKKENLNTKPAEENQITVVSQEKCPHLEPSDIHTPKFNVYCPAIQGCRSIDGFHVLNRIEEGTYGVVYRARDKQTKEIVALKRLKMEREKEGFPITSLREINTLLKAQHPNIVTVREIVVGSNMDRIYIVMDYVEHDLKSLMKTMPRPFLIGEVKTLLMQLLCAIAHLHDNWILHRDLKTSNLLLSHQGILKVGDFGLAREYGSPLKSYTPVVVTLWYRAPELLLGAKKYSTPIDMWSVGCIFGELLTKNALFPGKSESDQITRIFKELGTPSEKIWPGYSELPLVQSMKITRYPYNNLKSRFSHNFTDIGFDLLNKFLTYNPARRLSAEKAKSHEFFKEKPSPVPPNMFPTWPARSEQHHRAERSSPKAPVGGIYFSRQ